MKEPRIWLFDVELAPLLVYTWGIHDQNVGLNQIKQDWFLLSFAAKRLHDPEEKIVYCDVRGKKWGDDKALLEKLWKILNEADVVITQNGKSFDAKKANARFVIQGLKPVKPYKHIDTKVLAKKHFSFTSNSLEYLTGKLCKKYKKLKHKKFPGMELWTECLKNNRAAWEEMKLYNKHDVLALEELYFVLSPWEDTVHLGPMTEREVFHCKNVACGSGDIKKEGFSVTKSGRFQQYSCKTCGSWQTGKTNLLTKEKKKSLKGFD